LVGKLDQAGIPASACTGLYWQKGKINPGNTGSQPKHLQIRRDIKTTNKHLLVLDPMVFLYIFLAAVTLVWEPLEVLH
jgi:hypothetical protein